MDEMGSHVSMRIRSAIKAKLTELGVYVDNELPDYIMVLVVNKKTKEQMDNDLSLFLGHNTEHFTSWLTSVLEKLSAAAAMSASKDKSTEKDKEIKHKEINKSSEVPPREEVKKIETKKVDKDSEKLKEMKDKKKKEKKHEKKEKKRKKKEKKDIEKKLKKEAKKKAQEAMERATLNQAQTTLARAQALSASVESKTALSLPTILDTSKPSRTSEAGDCCSRKSPVEMKRSVMEATDGKGKTLTITKTIRNDHHKPEKHSTDISDDEDKATDVVSNNKKLEKKAAEIAVVKKKKSSREESIEKELEETVPDKPEVDAEEEEEVEEEERHVEDEEELVEEHIEVEEEELEEEEEFEEPTEDVVDMRVDVSDELEQEMQQDVADQNSKAKIKSKEGKSPLSVMDRLGPKKGTKRSHSASEEESEEQLSPGKCRVVNLLEESSFRRPDKKQIASKVVASGPPKRLEARVRPLSVVERSSRSGSPQSSRSQLASVVSRAQTDASDGFSEGEDTHRAGKQPTTMHSKVEVSSSRERRTQTDRRSANSALILRAVADAHRSVTSSKRTSAHLSDDESNSKKPKLEVFSRSYREREEGRLTASLKEAKIKQLSITVKNDASPDEAAIHQKASNVSSSLTKRLEERISIVGSGSKYHERLEPELRKQQLPVAAAVVAPLTPSSNMDDVEEYIEEVEEWEEDVESVGRASVSESVPTTAARAVRPLSDTNPLMMSLDELIQQTEPENKYSSRCMFWPACRLGSKCQYQHPTVPCKTFPNCTFGDKCLYIHPNCKYDALCTRPDCPYTHASPRSTTALPARSKLSLSHTAPRVSAPSAPVRRCHYGIKCTNFHCPFVHPKACKYGSACMTPGCQFTHPDFSSGAKLKWVAPKLFGASAATAAKDAEPPNRRLSTTTTKLIAHKVSVSADSNTLSKPDAIDTNGCTVDSAAAHSAALA